MSVILTYEEAAAVFYKSLDEDQKSDLILNISEAIMFMSYDKQQNVLRILEQASHNLSKEVWRRIV